jgi:hypothetical protein
MSFQSGRVSYCRFRVHAAPGSGAPTVVDETCLSILSENAFCETEIGTPDEVEVGWVTGDHILDTRFSFEKNGFGASTPGSVPGGVLLAAMRIDTHKVPADVKQAYRKINEQAAAAENPSGFASKMQKKEAAKLAGRQMREDLAAGRFRRSKMVPVLWDFANQTLYCGATSNAILENLAKLMKQSFAVDVDYLSAGTLASHLLRSRGHGRDYEDLKPSTFTTPPEAARQDHDDAEYIEGPRDMSVPMVPWVVQSVDLKDFLGNELLIWLWWQTELNDGVVKVTLDHGRTAEFFVAIDKALDMDCAWDATGKQTLRGHAPTRLPEAAEALAEGKWPRKLGLILSDGEHQWELTLQGDKMIVSSAGLPEIPEADGPRELMDARIMLMSSLDRALDAMYETFLRLRVSGTWPGVKRSISEWIRHRRRGRSAPVTPAVPATTPEPVVLATMPEPAMTA